MAEETGASRFGLVRIHKGELTQRSQDLVQRGLQLLRTQEMNELEQLFVRAGSDPSVRPAFYRLLLESTLLALTAPDPPVDENGNYKGGGEPLRLAVLARSDGNFVLMFTSFARLEAFVAQNPMPEATAGGTGTHGHVSTSGAHLFHVAALLGLSVVLNPG
jgi:hypothetical protein